MVILCCPILAVQGKLTSGDPGEARGVWGGAVTLYGASGFPGSVSLPSFARNRVEKKFK